MTNDNSIADKLANIGQDGKVRFALAFHIAFTAPTFLFQTYSKAWLDYYSQNGLLMRDPTVHWGFENTGTVRWSDLAEMDTTGVLIEAARHGLNHGVTCAIEIDGSRSIGSFSRADREFTAQEQTDLLTVTEDLHRDTAQIKTLSPATTDTLRKMSILYTHPES